MNTKCQELLDSLTQGILMLDNDRNIIYFNNHLTQLTGYSSEELLHQSFSILFGNDPVRMEYEFTITNKKGNFTSEGWRKKKNHEKYWGKFILNSLKDSDNNILGHSCLISDETEEKEIQLQLRNSEQRFRLMVESVRDYAIFMLDKNGVIISWNEGAQKTKGYSANEIIGKHFSIFYTAKDLDDKKPERELRIAIETGKYEEEGWRVRKNGSLFWANVVITALFDETNNHIGFSKVTRDLTEKKQNDEELRKSEERYRSLVEQITDYGIFLLDEKGRIASWNEGAKRMKGYLIEEILGKHFSIFYTEEDITKGKPAHELKVAIEKGKYEEEGWRVRKDGSRFWANVVITPVYNVKGIHVGFSKVTRDLSERLKAEMVIRENVIKYKELAKELKETNSELRLANEELEQFTSIVSHDLQEPVRSIKSFLQLLENKLNLGEFNDLKTYISKSIASANRMRELIKNLLQYSQLGKIENTEEEIIVEDLVNEVKLNLGTTIDSKKAEIILNSEIERFFGDRIQLVQLLQNLISNALKFNNNERPKVEIRCYEEGEYIKFAIADNGIGIEERDLKKIFEIFRRLNTGKTYPGTGIGLAICKKIVESYGGNIWPESNPGKGTTFYFTLHQQVKHKLQHEEV